MKKDKKKIRILFVAMSESIHTAKWISLLSDYEYEKALFPSNTPVLHEMLSLQKVRWKDPHPILKIVCKLFGPKLYNKLVSFRRIINKIFPSSNKEIKLYRMVKKFKPDIIHSMETQHAGYLVLSTKNKLFKNKKFPIWVHTNWGSDIYLFGRLDGHREKISQILSECDYYTCESKRDISLALEMGYKGHVFEPFPNACGFDIQSIQKTREQVRTSDRNLILVKGYQGWAGRGLFALRALALASGVLNDYEIIVYSADDNDAIKISVEILRQDFGMNIRVLENNIPNEEMLRFFAKARIYLGLSISDGISTSLLEAMAMGAFPIQSGTSTASEWIINNEGGFIVPAEDAEKVAECVKTAVQNDILVDTAAQENWLMILNNANSISIKQKINETYRTITSNFINDTVKRTR